MAKLVHSAQSFMNVEDAIIAKKRKKAEQMEAELPRHTEQGPRPKNARTGDNKDKDSKKVSLSLRQHLHYTPLNMPLDQVFMQIKDNSSLKWLERSEERRVGKECRP